MAAVAPAYEPVAEGESGGGAPGLLAGTAGKVGCGICLVVLMMLGTVLDYFATNWVCDPKAPASKYGWQYLPRELTLDESASGALDSIQGRSVNVFPGSGQHSRVAGEIPLGYFTKVFSWWGDKYGYVEHYQGGMGLRFAAHQKWTWLHSPHVLKPCDDGPIYEIARGNFFDGTFHNIYRRDTNGGENVHIGTAQHMTSGLDVGASLFNGVNLNIKWSIVFKGVSENAGGNGSSTLGMAYQWYDHNLIANYGASNWAVSSKNSSTVAKGVEPLPAHVVAYTSALYDLQTGSDRRRRSSSHHSHFSSRRR